MIAAGILALHLSLTLNVNLDLRIEPFLDLLCAVRAGSKLGVASHDLVAAEARKIELEFATSPLASAAVMGLAASCKDSREFIDGCASLPEETVTPQGKVALRSLALKFGSLLSEYEKEFVAKVFPSRRGEIERAKSQLDRNLIPNLDRVYSYLCEKLKFANLASAVRVLLVLDAPSPGAITVRGKGGAPVCVVGVNSFQGTQLIESVVHESLHALDVQSPESALSLVRTAIQKAAIDPKSRAVRDLPHFLIFESAAFATRKFLDPKHVAYGVTTKTYERLSIPYKEIEQIWSKYLEGNIMLDAAVVSIVGSLK